MKKQKLTQCVALLLALCSIGTTNAQTKLWGVGAAAGQADGQFQNAFVQSSTAGSYSATQWTALTVNELDATITPGSAYWVRNLTGKSQGAYATAMTAATSASAANGVALFDSDFMDNAGTVGGFGTGTSPSAHRGELISPRIDLTGATDSALWITFYSYYRPFVLTELSLSLSISVDDGATWGATADIKALQPTATNTATQGMVRAMFSGITSGVVNLTQCRIKFNFDGGYYYSIIDDITIQMAPDYNIAIGLPDINGANYFSVGNIIRIGNDNHIPLENIDFSSMEGWYFGAKVTNTGAKHILPSAMPRVRVNIDFVPNIIGVPIYGVYVDTVDAGVDSILSENPDGIGLVDYLRDLNFIMTHGAGTYNVTYWAEHNNPDATPADDTVRYSFVVTKNLPGISTHYISKARLSATDGKVFGSTQIFPGGSPHSAFEYGSVFYFPKGATNAVKIDSVDFRYFIPTAYVGATTQNLFVNVYRFIDGSNGGAANGLLAGAELSQIGIGVATLTGLGTTKAKGSRPYHTVTLIEDAAIGGPMAAFVDGGFYYISVLNNPSLTGGPATFGFNDVVIHAVDPLNYAMNIGKTSTTHPFSPSALAITDAVGTTSWYSGFTGFDEVPSIGVHLGISPLTNTTIVEEVEQANLNVYPNPAQSSVNVEISLENASDVRYIMTDVSGRVLYVNSSKNVTSEIHAIDVEHLAMGVYMIHAETDKGVTTKRFVKN